ncbi:SdrD B-like domain-containing protein [Frigoribacterium sp. Leaf186]|uniref:SdrD B-like domain-containing protein n=1 Tax=Frigoribacterium sp. Leaf186 TaxID=1736293 RepID=UPI000AE40886|nr:SdrD B-like domain-containing protein [Frigoribacterium sp. Leaf186]
MKPNTRLRRPVAVALALSASLSLIAVDAANAAPEAPTSDNLSLSVRLASDGIGPFTPNDVPGGDSGPQNGIVRTNDAVVYGVTVGTTTGDAVGGEIIATAPDGLTWSTLPGECLPGSAVTGQTLRCSLAPLSTGVRTLSIVASVDRDVSAGSMLRPTFQLEAPDRAPVTAPVSDVRVSAVPRFNVSMNRTVTSFAAATGPDGSTPGFRIVYPLQIDWQSLVPGDGLLGYEGLQGDITLIDDVSAMYGGEPSPAVLLATDTDAACGVNTGQIPAAPGGVGGGERNVVDSGTITCTQNAPGEPVSITISGADTSLSSIPTRSVSGGQITGGVSPYVVSAYVSLWVPTPPLGQSLTTRNTYRDLTATSISGQANYDGASEPTEDNSADRNILESAGVSGSLRYLGWNDETMTSFTMSGKYDEPYVTPAQTLLSSTSLNNRGLSTWSGSQVCAVFDNTTQTLRENTPGTWASSNRSGVTGRPQYAAFDGSDPEVARDATCDDALGWYDDPRDVPGGPSAVGAVRWSYDHPGNTSITFNVHLTAVDRLANDTRLRIFSSVRRDRASRWTHDTGDPVAANGNWADFLSVTSNAARITSAVVDPGHDASDTPDETTYVTAGGTLTYALYPTLTNASDDRVPEKLTIRDLLPVGSIYVPGSASTEPVIDEIVVDGVTRQRLTWSFDPVEVNDALAPLTFSARFTTATPGIDATNSATIESLRDVSSPDRRVTDRAVHVLAGSGFDVDETVDHDVRIVGDQATFRLTYTNIGSESLTGTSLITSLPHDGDDRGTEATVRPVLTAPVATVHDTEAVLYTNTPPTSVVDDPDDASNAPGGSTRWCAQGDFGSTGCPGALAEVTAVRIDRGSAVPAGTAVSHELVLAADGLDGSGDVWASSFGMRARGIDWLAHSPVARTTAVGGSIGRIVWQDANSDGIRQDDEAGLADHPVRLTGSDDRGEPVARAVSTDADGVYQFDSLRPGDYVVDFGAVEGGWTTPHVGDDPSRDSDAGTDGDAEAELTRLDDAGGALVGVSDVDDVDAGALPAPEVVDPPGETVDPPGETVDPPVDGDSSPGRDQGTDRAAGPADGRLRLAFTGAAPAAAAAAALVALALGLVMARRRRRPDETVAPAPGSPDSGGPGTD